MPTIEVARLRHVDAVLNYLDDAAPPLPYTITAAAGPERRQAGTVKHTVRIFDVRDSAIAPTLDDNGFTYLRQRSEVQDFFYPAGVTGDYYGECIDLVRRATGAPRVFAFDHNLRDKSLARVPNSTVREPVRYVHNDYTKRSAPQRVRDLLPAAAGEAAVARRFMFINVWRPIRGPVEDVPLAVCDASSLLDADFVATELQYSERTGEVYSVRFNPAHRWFYQSRMRADEVLLLKCFDAAEDGRARYTAHCAFHDPNAPPNPVPRRSIEVRTMALFD